MAQRNVRAETGNRIEVLFDDQRVGVIQSVRMSDDFAPEPLSGIGDIHALEHCPTMARHVLSVSYMVLKVGSLRRAGISALNGDDVLRGLVFDIVVLSKDDGSLLRKYVGCSYASGDLDVTKHTIVAASAMFNALDVVGDGG